MVHVRVTDSGLAAAQWISVPKTRGTPQRRRLDADAERRRRAVGADAAAAVARERAAWQSRRQQQKQEL